MEKACLTLRFRQLEVVENFKIIRNQATDDTPWVCYHIPFRYLCHKYIFLCRIDMDGIVMHIRREVLEVARFDDRATSTTPKL